MKKTAWIVLGTLAVLLVAGGAWLVVDRNTDDSGDSSAAPTATQQPAGAPAATGAEAAEAAAQPDTSDAPSWLFSTNADGGTLTEQADGTYALALTDVDRRITAFTDRPDRDAAVIPIRLLFQAWPELFRTSPPNAVLATEDAAGNSISLVVTLTDPQFDGTTATFTADVVDTTSRRAEITVLGRSAPATPPATFGAANLFIDDVKSVFTCSNQHLQTINPPGYISMDSTSAQLSTFQQECKAAGGQVMVMSIGS